MVLIDYCKQCWFNLTSGRQKAEKASLSRTKSGDLSLHVTRFTSRQVKYVITGCVDSKCSKQCRKAYYIIPFGR